MEDDTLRGRVAVIVQSMPAQTRIGLGADFERLWATKALLRSGFVQEVGQVLAWIAAHPRRKTVDATAVAHWSGFAHISTAAVAVACRLHDR